jgi:hypothetical protein
MKTLHIISAGAMQAVVTELVPAFEQSSGAKVSATFGAVGQKKARVLAGEPSDVILLTPEMLDDLSTTGWVVPGSQRTLGRVGMDDPRDERSGRRVARDDDGAGITPGQEPRRGVEPQASLLRQGPVAGEAAVGEHAFERRAPSGRVGRGYRPAGDRGARHHHGQHRGIGGAGRRHGRKDPEGDSGLRKSYLPSRRRFPTEVYGFKRKRRCHNSPAPGFGEG